jgi:hypothetical protein
VTILIIVHDFSLFSENNIVSAYIGTSPFTTVMTGPSRLAFALPITATGGAMTGTVIGALGIAIRLKRDFANFIVHPIRREEKAKLYHSLPVAALHFVQVKLAHPIVIVSLFPRLDFDVLFHIVIAICIPSAVRYLARAKKHIQA